MILGGFRPTHTLVFLISLIRLHSYFFFLPQKFQDIEESHIVHMKEIIRLYSQSIDETHVQIGEVSMTAGGRPSCGRPVDPPYAAAK